MGTDTLLAWDGDQPPGEAFGVATRCRGSVAGERRHVVERPVVVAGRVRGDAGGGQALRHLWSIIGGEQRGVAVGQAVRPNRERFDVT
jgi:hypothetical protein